MNFKHFFKELKRRNVFKVATAYAIAGWLIIQVVATVSPQLNFPEWVPSAITIFVLCGFPLALIFAWAFELTPDGLKKTDKAETSKEFEKSKSKKINSTIIAILSIALVFLLIERVFFADSNYGADENLEASIAVLPFVNMSDDKSNEYFSDGLSEELLNGLAKIEGMQVAGRTSSFSFKGKNEDLRQIANELNVNHILEGSVRKDGNNIRVTAQLIKADDGYHVWSETYDRELKSVFEIQEEISREVIKELKLRILPEEEKSIKVLPTNSTKAYDLFLKATQTEVSRNAEDLQKAVDLYKGAIALDENFSLAHSRLAIVYSLLNDYGNIRLEESMALMKVHIDKAIAIGDDLGMAYLAQGMAYSDIPEEDSFEKADEFFQKALKYLPNYAYLHNALQINYNQLNNQELQEKHLLKAYELDPLSPPIASNTAGYYYREGNYEKADRIINQIIEKYPDYMPIYGVRYFYLISPPNGDLAAGFKFTHNILKDNPKNLRFLLSLSKLSTDLNLIGLAENYTGKLQLLYPNNFDVAKRQYNLNTLKGNHNLNIEMMQSFIDRFGDMASKPTAEPSALSYISLGDYQKAIFVIENAFPEFRDNTLVLNDESINGKPYELLNTLELYIYLQKFKGDQERASMYTAKLSQRFDYGGFKDKPLDSLSLEELFQKASILGLENQPEAMVKIWDEIYFKRKAKLSGIFSYKYSPAVKFYKDNTAVKAFSKRVIADITNMRREVISYLKAEGDWNDNWSEE